MKKLILAAAVLFTIGLVACGGKEKADVTEETVQVEEVADTTADNSAQNDEATQTEETPTVETETPQ